MSIPNPIIQRGLTHCGDVEQWCQLLLKAFELSPDETFAAFDAVRYTVRDALNRRDPQRYIHFLTSAAKQCGVPENQWALWAWQHLEQPIRRLIPKPGKGVTSRGFEDVLQKSGNTGMQSLHGMRISPAIRLAQRRHFQSAPRASHPSLLILLNPCSQFSLSSLFNQSSTLSPCSQFPSFNQLCPYIDFKFCLSNLGTT